MKKALAGVVAAGVFLAGAGTAFASSWRSAKPMAGGGVSFSQIEYRFHPAHHHNGAFEWKGDLKDERPGDGHNVYVQVQVEGRGWVRYYGKQRRTVRLHHFSWEGSQLYTDDASLGVCVDNGALEPDDCVPAVHFQNHR
ncbi:hypothetical protein ACWCV9_18745 [Streptomyces sp. NPDC001606]